MDKKIFKWLNKDAINIIRQKESIARKTLKVEGKINIDCKKYIINEEIEGLIFGDE